MSKDFNLVYRAFVADLISFVRRDLLAAGLRGTDAQLASLLHVESNTISRLRRKCFNASPVVLVNLLTLVSSWNFYATFTKYFGDYSAQQNELLSSFIFRSQTDLPF